MECPICYEEYCHAPGCPTAMEIEADEIDYDEYKTEREKALKALKQSNIRVQRTAKQSRPYWEEQMERNSKNGTVG